ncbi:DUF4411 family protein [Salinicoccus hispanicus]|uniref:DUF4411 family protein n=1 Tax=Salinicoccus hispanicus TaxID=157225 RepID=A0A6N8U2H7_9STAP|nr:DUF4411 family protein [Salinicoccus hispanicus]MXQ52012.1 DUF4411 family protein [Salinicoccus hispanicus]
MEFIMDANTYIDAHRRSYPFDLFPGYWERIVLYSKKGSIKLNTHVYNEIAQEDKEPLKDDLQLWLENEFEGENLKVSQDVVDTWIRIINYVGESDLYNQKALDAWADGSVADPWIIATAKVHDLTVVTMETKHGNLSSGSPTKAVKVPDVCEAFDVRCLTLPEMLRQLQFEL